MGFKVFPESGLRKVRLVARDIPYDTLAVIDDDCNHTYDGHYVVKTHLGIIVSLNNTSIQSEALQNKLVRILHKGTKIILEVV